MSRVYRRKEQWGSQSIRERIYSGKRPRRVLPIKSRLRGGDVHNDASYRVRLSWDPWCIAPFLVPTAKSRLGTSLKLDHPSRGSISCFYRLTFATSGISTRGGLHLNPEMSENSMLHVAHDLVPT